MSAQLPIFHLAFPVADLARAKAFYVDLLDARIGRDTGRWADILFLGHQLTLHERPNEVLPAAQRGVRHFGAILPWQEWQALGEKLRARGVTFELEPTISKTGTDEEQGKMLLSDPSGNQIELKTYRHPEIVLGLTDDGSFTT